MGCAEDSDDRIEPMDEAFIRDPGERAPGLLRGWPLCPGNERKEATAVTCTRGGPRLPAGGRFAAYRFLTNLPGHGIAGVVHASDSAWRIYVIAPASG